MKATLPGGRVHYSDDGEGSGVPILLIHGFPFSRAMWRPQIAEIQKNRRVVAYDVRGHGKSEVGDGHYTIESFVDDLFDLMDHLELPQAVLCGLSMGGYIALRAVERQPERARALVLADTRSEADSDEAKLKRAAALRTLQSDGVEAFASGFLKTALAPATLDQKPELAATVRRLILANSPRGIAGALLALAARTDTTAALERISVPTLLLAGSLDAFTPPAVLRAMQNRIRGSEMREIPNAGHLSNLENPGEFNARLIEFLDRIP